MNQMVAGKCLGQAVQEDRVSLLIHTKCVAVVISLLIISCGLRDARSHGITSLATPIHSVAQLHLQRLGLSLGAEGPSN